MSKQHSGREQLTGCLWLILVPLSIWFLYWLFSSDKKDTYSRSDYSTSSSSSATDYSVKPYSDITKLKKEIKSEMRVADIPIYEVEKTDESPCLLVYTSDNGEERDGLALTICSSAERYGIECVSIRDQKGNTLGRSRCK